MGWLKIPDRIHFFYTSLLGLLFECPTVFSVFRESVHARRVERYADSHKINVPEQIIVIERSAYSWPACILLFSRGHHWQD